MGLADLPDHDPRPLTQKWQKDSRYDRKKQAQVDAAAIRRATWKAVDTRDRRICRACGRLSDPEGAGLTQRGHRHHIQYRSAGGADETANVVTLCAACHNDEHQHRLKVDGNADEALTFWRTDDKGEWFISRQEIAPHVTEKD